MVVDADGNIVISTGGPTSQVLGVYGYAVGNGDSSVYLDGTVTIDTAGTDSFVRGIWVKTGGTGDVYVDTNGLIDISTTGASAEVAGLFGTALDAGDVAIHNDGGMNITTDGIDAGVAAIRATATLDGDVDVYSVGGVYVSTEGDASSVAGIGAYAMGNGDVYVGSNGGLVIHTLGDGAPVTGIRAIASGTGHVKVDSLGATTITTDGDNSGVSGISAVAVGGGYAYAYNYGYLSISTHGLNGDVSGLLAQTSLAGNAFAQNDGGVYVYTSGDHGYVEAVSALALGTGDAGVKNDGGVEIHTYGDFAGAYGIRAIASGGGDASIFSDGVTYITTDGEQSKIIAMTASATAAGNVFAYDNGGIEAHALGYQSSVVGINAIANGTGYVNVGNYGGADISTAGDDADATAISAVTIGGGNVDVDNGGYTVVHTAGAGSSATGVFAVVAGGDGNMYVSNDGGIHADATGADGYASGIFALASGNGYAYVYNDGGVEVSALGVNGYANGIVAQSLGNGEVKVGNDGGVIGSTAGDEAKAQGIVAFAGGTGNVSVYGAGGVNLRTDGYNSDATGVRATAAGGGDVSVDLHGAITVNTYGQYANAFGIYAVAAGGGDTYVHNYAGIDVYAADANATGAVAISDTGIATFQNDASDYAGSGAYDATGAFLAGAAGAKVYNNDSIAANAVAGDGTAIAVEVLSGGEARVYNYEGSYIDATSGGLAIGVMIETDVYGYVLNDGELVADGGVASYAVASTGASDDTILNHGLMTGGILSGDGLDYLYNSGTWNAGAVSNFGAADDSIVNSEAGTINFNDSQVFLGSHSDAGNSFVNYGLINVAGDTNLIDMGSGEDTLVPSLNPLPFENNGVIDFQDGAPDDMLTVYGDFAGEGTINVDADVDTETGDLLFIDGSVVNGTVQTINVDLANAEFEFFQIPLVAVSGDSQAGQFVLGDINFNPGGNGIVLVSLGIFADIDASNATNDIFYLGFSVDGVADAGTIGAALGGGAATMLRTNIGTWRQREGVVRAENDSAITLWGRVFSDKGDVEPEHFADNFGQLGNFNHELKVTGFEAGGDFNVADEFHLGLMVATLNGDIRLHSPGVGDGDIDGTSWGIYGTWLPGNGFYADLSYRWMDFDASVDAGPIHDNNVDGSAEAFNIELGYAFKTAGGLEIEPQLQYTRINVDEFDSTLDGPDTTMELLGGDTTRTRFGVALRKSFESASGWTWTPHGTLSTVDESDSEMDFVVNGQWTGRTDTDGRSTMLELGLDAAKGGWAIFGGLNWSDGGAYDSFVGGQIGVRYTFGGAAPVAPPPPAPPAKTCADLDDDGDGINNCDDKCLGSTAGETVGADGCPVPPPPPVEEPKPFRG